MMAAASATITSIFSHTAKKLESAGFDLYQVAMIHAVGLAAIGVITAFTLALPLFGGLFVALFALSVLGLYVAHQHHKLKPFQTIVTDMRQQHETQNTELTGRISDLTGEIVNLRGANTDLQGTIATLQTQWTEYNRTHADHIASLSTIMAQVGLATGQLETLTPQLRSVKEELAVEQERLAVVRASLQEQVGQLQVISASLGGHLETLPQLAAAIATLERVLTHLNPNLHSSAGTGDGE